MKISNDRLVYKIPKNELSYNKSLKMVPFDQKSIEPNKEYIYYRVGNKIYEIDKHIETEIYTELKSQYENILSNNEKLKLDVKPANSKIRLLDLGENIEVFFNSDFFKSPQNVIKLDDLFYKVIAQTKEEYVNKNLKELLEIRKRIDEYKLSSSDNEYTKYQLKQKIEKHQTLYRNYRENYLNAGNSTKKEEIYKNLADFAKGKLSTLLTAIDSKMPKDDIYNAFILPKTTRDNEFNQFDKKFIPLEDKFSELDFNQYKTMNLANIDKGKSSLRSTIGKNVTFQKPTNDILAPKIINTSESLEIQKLLEKFINIIKTRPVLSNNDIYNMQYFFALLDFIEMEDVYKNIFHSLPEEEKEKLSEAEINIFSKIYEKADLSQKKIIYDNLYYLFSRAGYSSNFLTKDNLLEDVNIFLLLIRNKKDIEKIFKFAYDFSKNEDKKLKNDFKEEFFNLIHSEELKDKTYIKLESFVLSSLNRQKLDIKLPGNRTDNIDYLLNQLDSNLLNLILYDDQESYKVKLFSDYMDMYNQCTEEDKENFDKIFCDMLVKYSDKNNKNAKSELLMHNQYKLFSLFRDRLSIIDLKDQYIKIEQRTKEKKSKIIDDYIKDYGLYDDDLKEEIYNSLLNIAKINYGYNGFENVNNKIENIKNIFNIIGNNTLLWQILPHLNYVKYNYLKCDYIKKYNSFDLDLRNEIYKELKDCVKQQKIAVNLSENKDLNIYIFLDALDENLVLKQFLLSINDKQKSDKQKLKEICLQKYNSAKNDQEKYVLRQELIKLAGNKIITDYSSIEYDQLLDYVGNYELRFFLSDANQRLQLEKRKLIETILNTCKIHRNNDLIDVNKKLEMQKDFIENISGKLEDIYQSRVEESKFGTNIYQEPLVNLCNLMNLSKIEDLKHIQQFIDNQYKEEEIKNQDNEKLDLYITECKNKEKMLNIYQQYSSLSKEKQKIFKDKVIELIQKQDNTAFSFAVNNPYLIKDMFYYYNEKYKGLHALLDDFITEIDKITKEERCDLKSKFLSIYQNFDSTKQDLVYKKLIDSFSYKLKATDINFQLSDNKLENLNNFLNLLNCNNLQSILSNYQTDQQDKFNHEYKEYVHEEAKDILGDHHHVDL